MDISKIDLNLLVVFEAMFQTQNVTVAAERVGVSQSTMSYALAKLRRLFNDPLFVRTSRGMQPTPHALQLAEPVRRALDIVKTDILKQFRFDPLKSKRTFTLCMTDVAEANFLPKVLSFLSTEAPHVDLRTVIMERTEMERAMASGEVDLAIGYFPELKKAGFYQQRLFPHSFVCIVRKSHPRIGNKMTLQQFLEESHAVVRPEGRSHEIVERVLEKRRLSRRVVLNTRSFTSVPLIIAESDLIATVPMSIGITFGNLKNIRMVPLPFQVPAYDIRQHWHERFHNDAEMKWFRKRIADIFMVK